MSTLVDTRAYEFFARVDAPESEYTSRADNSETSFKTHHVNEIALR